MTLLSPIFLWSFAALLPLAAVYFLKVRPRKRPTTAYFLWEKLFTEKKANSLLSKLRDVFSLLLMVLAFAAVILALTRPAFEEDARRDLLIMIDVSASMQSESGGSTRLEEALKEARGMVHALNGNQRAAVVTVGEAVRFLSGFTESPRELLDAIEEIEPFPGALRAAALSEFISGSDPWSEDLRAILITDGSFHRGGLELDGRIEVRMVGEPVENVGLTLADLIRLPNGNLGLYYRVASSFEIPVEADLIVKQGGEHGRIFKLIPLLIEPGLNDSEFFEIEDGPAGEWTAEISLADSLAVDNVAWLTVNEARPIPVFVATDQRYFYETSVLSFENASSPLTLAESAAEAEVMIFQGEGTTVEGESAKLHIHFAPEGESELWESLGERTVVEFPRVRAEDHPALKYLDVEAISFSGARELTTPGNASVLVESEAGVPLLYRIATPERTALIVNMDPVEAGFYFSAWFPTFLYSASIHLAGRESELASTEAVGNPIDLPRSEEGGATLIREPGGDLQEIDSDLEGWSPEKVGFYEIENSTGTWSLGSSLLSLFDTAPPGTRLADTTEDLAMGRGIPYWLLALAIVVLVSESLLYHRRKVG
ncbi:MAG: BatA and WFA domain-containing protein [Verrucomicrobiota bacterium]